MEWWSGGVVEWWSGGVVEWWSGGVVEWTLATEVILPGFFANWEIFRILQLLNSAVLLLRLSLFRQKRIIGPLLFLRRQKAAQICFNLGYASGRRLDAVHLIELLHQALISVANDGQLRQEIDWHDGFTLFDTAHQPGEGFEVFSRERKILDLHASSRRIGDLNRDFLQRVVDLETKPEVVFTLERKVLDFIPLVARVEVRSPAFHVRQPVIHDRPERFLGIGHSL
jgi:hypothetical protein